LVLQLSDECSFTTKSTKDTKADDEMNRSLRAVRALRGSFEAIGEPFSIGSQLGPRADFVERLANDEPPVAENFS
jgi:hypothetical protein